ncbi:SGNH/GDSL hydrolase family protein [Exiguobacterium aestuarii]|uniref:SGNH/GDSL hydrolase family protein n=1 Tax=Exiguobacterium aestuarii TaxID=273527 RepID=UPI001CD1B067|nr:SGNH/GDSL hydrolase family protein [Exiguobacterium aestuarii]MCA0980250.1 SGNH/GDSL hydrolase family protein [Exiguobacterium aestuarii]
MTDYNIDFKDHKVQFPNRFKQVQVSPGVVDLIPTWIENPSEVIEEGTPVNADLFDKLRANVTRRSETFAATAGQTVFNLTSAYIIDQGRIDVYISGGKQRSGVDFTETSPTSFTLSEGLDAGTIVEAVYFSASQALSEDLIEQVQAAEAATIAANEATADAINATEAALTANLIWKEPVNNLTALNALSNPQTRDTRQTKDTGNVYRYDGSAWVLIQTMDPNAITALDTRLTSQLADIETQTTTQINAVNEDLQTSKTEFDADIQTARTEQINPTRIDLNSIPSSKLKIAADADRIKLANLSDEVLQAMAGNTSVNVTPSAGSVTTEKVATGAVTPDKTSFAKTVLATQNLFNKDGVLTNGYNLDSTNGSLYVKADWSVSDFIEVKPNTTYTANNTDRIVEYNAGKVFVKTVLAPTKTITTGATAKYVRISAANTNIATLMLVEGNTVPTQYQPYDMQVLIEKLRLDEVAVKSLFFEGDKLKGSLKVDMNNVAFLYRDSVNLFDKSRITADARLNTNGTTTARNDYNISDFIEITPNTQYAYSYAVEVVEYDANKQYIRGVSGATTMTTSANAAFVKHSIYDPHLDVFMFVQGTSVPADYVPYDVYSFSDTIKVAKETQRYEGKTWNVLGDSITNRPAYSYWTVLRQRLGFAQVNNYGVSGSSIAVRAGRTDSMVERYSSMVDADVITLLGGTNDFGSNVPLGTMADRVNTTFYGACHILLSGLVTKYPTKTLAVFTTIPRYNMQETNGQGLYVHDYMDALREVAGFYGIASFDILRNSQIKAYNETAKTAYIPDGLHPNDAGYDLLAAQMLPLMEGL